MPRSPLPLRDGLNAVRVRLPPGDWTTIGAYLEHRFSDVERFGDAASRLQAAFEVGEIVDNHGRSLQPESRYRSGGAVYLYRDPPAEVAVPFEIEILHRDDDLVVVDKPHFMATIPRGRHVMETVLVRLRRDLGLADLAPAHRLDRLTAGVLVLTTRPEVRRAYQELFSDREVVKTYEAVAPVDPGLVLPRTVRSRIAKEHGVMRAEEVPGDPNSETRVELIDVRDDSGLGLYRLRPVTGRTHQLRLHMNSLGVPIVGDNYYPSMYEVGPGDFSAPLQLVARSIEFADPYTGAPRRFESPRPLTAWTS